MKLLRNMYSSVGTAALYFADNKKGGSNMSGTDCGFIPRCTLRIFMA
jgi:hypothetical protein